MGISIKKARELANKSSMARAGAPVAGSLVGAIAGGAIGSAVPGVGTLAGIGVGQALGTGAGALAGEGLAQMSDQELNDMINKEAEATDAQSKKKLDKAARLAALDALANDRWNL